MPALLDRLAARFADWDEAAHPRGEGGRFGAGASPSGASSSGQSPVSGRLPVDPVAAKGAAGAREALAAALARASGLEKGSDDYYDAVADANDAKMGVFSAWLASARLPEATRAEYALAVQKCLSRLPAHAVLRMSSQVDAVHFHADLASLNDYGDRFRSGPKSREAGCTGGMWQFSRGGDAPNHGVLHLAGNRIGGPGGKSLDCEPADIYAHEFGHALDGHGEFSGHSDWKKAWSAEVDLPHAPLSAYARLNPCEGFAEFGRLVMTDPQTARENHPRCWDFWNQRGLTY